MSPPTMAVCVAAALACAALLSIGSAVPALAQHGDASLLAWLPAAAPIATSGVASDPPYALTLCSNGCTFASDSDSCFGTVDPPAGSPPYNTSTCIKGKITYLGYHPVAMRALQLASGPKKGQWVMAFFDANSNECTNRTSVLSVTSPGAQEKCDSGGFSINNAAVPYFIVSGDPTPTPLSPSDPTGSNKALIIGLSVGGGVAVLIGIGLVIWCCKRGKRHDEYRSMP